MAVVVVMVVDVKVCVPVVVVIVVTEVVPVFKLWLRLWFQLRLLLWLWQQRNTASRIPARSKAPGATNATPSLHRGRSGCGSVTKYTSRTAAGSSAPGAVGGHVSCTFRLPWSRARLAGCAAGSDMAITWVGAAERDEFT